MIDLRSDTVTRPSVAMRKAMAEAEVGDDVFGEDPTVRRLEERAAAILGFEAALFVPSGTMGNQVAIAVHTRPGQEVIVEERCHVFHYELGAMAALSGVLPRPVASESGTPTAEAVERWVRPDASYYPKTGLICLENTHNTFGGTVMEPGARDALLAVARRHAIPVHLDGARIWNAATALECDASELVAGFDSVMFCLSKGLGAPVGSMLLSSKEFVAEARRVRKRFGGGMRQSGVLAAAGLVALENRTRLREDHDNARRLARAIDALPGLHATWGGTNIVMMDTERDDLDAARISAELAAREVAALPFDARRIRLVTHLDVTAADIDRTIGVLGAIAGVE